MNLNTDTETVRGALEEGRAIATGYVDWDSEETVRWFTEAIDALERIVKEKS